MIFFIFEPFAENLLHVANKRGRAGKFTFQFLKKISHFFFTTYTKNHQIHGILLQTLILHRIAKEFRVAGNTIGKYC